MKKLIFKAAVNAALTLGCIVIFAIGLSNMGNPEISIMETARALVEVFVGMIMGFAFGVGAYNNIIDAICHYEDPVESLKCLTRKEINDLMSDMGISSYEELEELFRPEPVAHLLGESEISIGKLKIGDIVETHLGAMVVKAQPYLEGKEFYIPCCGDDGSIVNLSENCLK